jgi:plasmid maintenance system antidote protein VapI
MSVTVARRYVAEEMTEVDQSGALFDYLRAVLKIKSDKALAEWLEIDQPRLSNIRSGRRRVGASLILHIHEKLDLPVSRIRDLLAGVVE